jgi:hypothetical protein
MAEEPAAEAVGPWTVKGVPAEDRQAINAAARRADLTVGEWLRRAAQREIQAERSGPPGLRPVEDLGHTATYPAASPAPSVEVVERLTAVLPGLTSDAKGGGKLAGLARRVIEQHLRALLLEGGSPPAGHPNGPPLIGRPK